VVFTAQMIFKAISTVSQILFVSFIVCFSFWWDTQTQYHMMNEALISRLNDRICLEWETFFKANITRPGLSFLFFLYFTRLNGMQKLFYFYEAKKNSQFFSTLESFPKTGNFSVEVTKREKRATKYRSFVSIMEQ
jgi:hypothetical protein